MPVPERELQSLPPQPGALGRGRTNTAANLIYRVLRGDIVSMRRKPGSPVNEKEIALAHRVSRTPVREALRELEVQGLLTRHHRRILVASLSAAEADEETPRILGLWRRGSK